MTKSKRRSPTSTPRRGTILEQVVSMNHDDLSTLRNIGPKIEHRLHEISVHNRRDLESLGAAEAYRRIQARHPGETIPVCYYLYSLQGALMGLHWDKLPPGMKDRLRAEVAPSRRTSRGRKATQRR